MKLQKLSKKIGFALSLWLVFCGASLTEIHAQATPTCFSITAGNLTYTENFDSLGTTGGSAAPGAFGFVETGTGAAVNQTFIAGTGSSTAGDTYNFGTAAAPTDRAFGELTSGTVSSIIGACFTNNTGATLNSFSISYAGEQYRLGATGRADLLNFQYSTSATSLTTGTYIDFDALDFSSPTTTGTTGALDGNANRTVKPLTAITPTGGIPSGATIYIRFTAADITGSDDALAIDDFTFTAATAPTAASVPVSGRVLGANNRPVNNARVYLTNQNGETRTAVTNAFGYYRFPDVEVGLTYTFNVLTKRYQFQPQVVTITEENENLNFTAAP